MKNYLTLAFIAISINILSAQNPKVIVSTEVGDLVIEIFQDKAPLTSLNFLKYVDAGKYNKQSCFYRVVRLDNQPDKLIKIEVIQGGFNEDSIVALKQFSPIAHETTKTTGILHKDGVISMARMEPGSASSEFFICINDQPDLDFGGKRNPDGQGFAAFGKVIKGMDIARKIQQLKDNNQYLQRPIKILLVKRI
jgi:peptidyl-prolyl cis-trans isomerase A (cyclophilin A)